MKSNQIWTMEGPVSGPSGHESEEDWIYLRSAFDRYLGVDKDGNVTGDSEEKSNTTKFRFMPQGDGQLALMAHNGFFFGGTGDHLSAKSHGPGASALAPTDKWTVHLAMHPQINLRNVRRNTYLHLTKDGAGANVNEEIPWGQDSMITFEFDSATGKYALRMCNNKYLCEDGSLSGERVAKALYTLVFSGTALSFRGEGGKYLAGVAAGRAECRQPKITKDELWLLEDSHPQVNLFNVAREESGRSAVSIRASTEVKANQEDVTDHEIFQMEINRETNKWSFRGNNKKYFSVSGTAVSCTATSKGDSEYFDVEWYGPQIALKACNDKYVMAKPNGQLVANGSDGSAPEARFIFDLINRPILVLRFPFGFVGIKGESKRLECNRSSYEVFVMTHEKGTYHLKSAAGQWWKQDSDGYFTVNGDSPMDFHLELLRHTHFAVRVPAAGNNYLKGEKNGTFKATGTAVDSSTLWEY